MKNRFSKIMEAKSEVELENVLKNTKNYQQEAVQAAQWELDRRRLEKPNDGADSSKESIDLYSEPDRVESIEDIETEEVSAEEKRDFGYRPSPLKALRIDSNYFVTPLIILLNIAIYVAMAIMSGEIFEFSIELLLAWGGNLKELTFLGEPWRLITSAFLHGGLIHLMFNMYALLFLGRELEIQFGNRNYLFAYICLALLASLISASFNSNVVSVGASGAIFGMYGLFLTFLWNDLIKIPTEERKGLVTSILIFTGYNLFYGFTQEGIDNAAHIGGFLSGIAIGGFYSFVLKRSWSLKTASIMVSVLILLLILILPNIVSNELGNYQKAMNQFILNEERTLWIHETDLSMISEEEHQEYYQKLKADGVDLWRDNYDLLNDLPPLPEPYEAQRQLLLKYCTLKIEWFEVLQSLLLKENIEDQLKLMDLTEKAEAIVQELSLHSASM